MRLDYCAALLKGVSGIADISCQLKSISGLSGHQYTMGRPCAERRRFLLTSRNISQNRPMMVQSSAKGAQHSHCRVSLLLAGRVATSKRNHTRLEGLVSHHRCSLLVLLLLCHGECHHTDAAADSHTRSDEGAQADQGQAGVDSVGRHGIWLKS